VEIWKDVDLYERGLKDFESLSSMQQDWFLIKHFDIRYEMQGGFGEVLFHAGDRAQLRQLKDALRRLGDIVSAGMLTKLEHIHASKTEEIESISRSYYDCRQQRWSLLERRLQELGVEIDETP
jgi:hypothetical protein